MPEIHTSSVATGKSAATPPDAPTGLRRFVPSRQWIRQHFSHQENMSRLRSLIWVIPLTILIWIYARQEQIVTESNITFPIEVISNDPNRVVTLVYPTDKNLVAELAGPRAQLEEAKRKLWPKGGAASVHITVDATRLGEYQISTLPQLQGNPLLAGIHVDGVQPVSLGVRIDRLVTRQVPIDAPDGLTAVRSVRFTPAMVEIRGPEEVLKEAERTHKLVVQANLAGLPALNQPGTHELEVSLTSPLSRQENVTLTPTTVHAVLEVREANEILTISSLPIWAAGPTDLWSKYRVQFLMPQPFLTNVAVIGPHDKIEQLKNQGATAQCKAYIDVTSEDLPPGQTHTRQVRFDLPEGVRLAPGSANIRVDFKLVAAGTGD